MRILILCGATFVVGLLAGSLFLAESGGSRSRTHDLRTRGSDDPGGSYRGSDPSRMEDEEDFTPAAPARGGDADVRSLAREAARDIARIKSSARAEEFLAGDGTIRGTVRDSAGKGVDGVVITAVPEAQPANISIERRWSRQRPHQDRDLSRVASEAIAVELWRRDSRRVATTDANGKFVITGLSAQNHRLTGFHERFEVQPLNQRNRVQPDATVDFIAKPIHEMKIEVRMPDGTLAEYARLTWTGTEKNGAEMWTRERGTVRMPLGALKIQARVWLPVPMESEEVEHVVTAGSDEPLVLELKGRRVLTATLQMPAGFATPTTMLYRLRLLDGTEEVEPESVLRNASQPGAYMPTPSRAYFFDIEPGRYLVAAFLNKRRLIAHAEAEVIEGSEEVVLQMEPPDPDDYMTVKLVGPDGGPVSGRVSFRVVPTIKGRPRPRVVDAIMADDAWLVYIDGIEGADTPDASLRVGTRDYGGAVEPIRLRGHQAVTIRFGKPAKVSVKLDGYKGSGVEGALFVALRGELGADAWQKVAADGSADLRGVQPGPYHLNLFLRRGGKNYPIYQRRINLRAGDEDIEMPVPRLHTLTVRWAGRGRPRNAILRCKDEMIGSMRRDAPLRGKVATFKDLAAGTYTVECARKRETVRVPGPPEITLK